nr:hypothetical protein [bacterium]
MATLNNQYRRSMGVNIGGATLVMVFAVLCLTIFSCLSLMSANAEKKMAQRTAQAARAYAAADLAATDTLCRLQALVEAGAGRDELARAGAAVLEGEQGLYLSYTQLIDETQQLQVTLAAAGGHVRIVCWQVAPTGQWNPQDSLSVWDGQAQPS